MAQAENSNVTHLPASIASLWSEHWRLCGELDVATNDDSVRLANDALWEIDDRLMATPAAGVEQLKVKAKVISARWQLNGGNEVLDDYVGRLLADIAKLAPKPGAVQDTVDRTL